MSKHAIWNKNENNLKAPSIVEMNVESTQPAVMGLRFFIVIIALIVPLIDGWFFDFDDELDREGGLFERQDDIINLAANSEQTIESIGYRKKSSARVTVLGEVGQTISLVCRISFSRRSRGCSDDYFYIGYNLNPTIRGARYYCGQRTLRKSSRPTSGVPVLVIGNMSKNNHSKIYVLIF